MCSSSRFSVSFFLKGDGYHRNLSTHSKCAIRDHSTLNNIAKSFQILSRSSGSLRKRRLLQPSQSPCGKCSSESSGIS